MTELALTIIIAITVLIGVAYYTITVFLNSKEKGHSERSQVLLNSMNPWRSLFLKWLNRTEIDKKENK